MGPHYLQRLVTARSIAIIGASQDQEAVGSIILHNLQAMGYSGEIFPINPKYKKIQGLRCTPSLANLERPVDLAIIATPPDTVPELLHQCHQAQARGVMVMSAGFSEAGANGIRLKDRIREAVQTSGLRVIGPNCFGLMRPKHKINATFSRNTARPGHLALVSQSGAMCTAVLDWAERQGIGFSLVTSLGDAADVDFGDILDFLALDPETRSILLYVEGIRNARGFMSGLRAAARMKPVIVMKAGRNQAGAAAAMTHTGSLVGADDVFTAALERAGVVRVNTVQQLFSAASVLSGSLRSRGKRLAIVTNAGGPGVVATDHAIELDLSMAELAPETLEQLNAALPPHWSQGNPLDILGAADPQRYQLALSACLADRGVDGVLVMLAPQAMTQAEAIADTVIKTIRSHAHGKPVLTCWMGGEQVSKARERLYQEKIPHFITPEASVEAFAYLAAYQHNQRLLLQVPGPLSDRSPADIDGARMIIQGVLAEGRRQLTTMESKAVLAAFRIPITQTIPAHTASEALVAASSLGYPLAMKIASPDITHKSDVGGVRLNLTTAEAVRKAFQTMMQEAAEAQPQARLDGVTLERMYRSHYGRELMVGVLRDRIFGPVISFGSGGTSVEVLQDRAVALPPLNETIIRGMIGRTRVARLLQRFRHMPAVDIVALEQVLLRISEMVCEIPEIVELDINPLIVDADGLAAIDARMVIDRPPEVTDRYTHMAIHPYPAQWIEEWPMADGVTLTIRPMRPEDAQIEQAFVRSLSDQARYFRFMQAVHELTQEMLVRFTQIDYDRDMALIAVIESEAGDEQQVAVARYTANPDQHSCEFAIAVADEWQGRGIGAHLMQALMRIAKSRGLRLMEGEIMARNNHMRGLMRRLNFRIRPNPDDDGIVEASREL